MIIVAIKDVNGEY